MFLSPILILALLFSSCDDSEKAAPIETTKVTVSGTGATLSGTEQSNGNFTVDLSKAQGVKPEGSKGSIKIELTSSTQATVTSEDLELPNALLKDGEIVIEASSTDGYTLGSETIEKVKITGTYATEGTTLTITKVELTKKAEEAPAAVTVNLSKTDVTVTGSGTASDKINALTQGSIDLATANLKDTTTVSGATGVKITFTAAGKAKIEGTLTLASGVQNVGDSVEFTQNIPVSGVTGIQSIESVKISGSGSGAQWQATGIAINATAQAEEPVTVTLSGTDLTVTGSGTGKTAIEALTTGSIALTKENLTNTDTVAEATDVKITFTAAGKASLEGTLTLASGKSDVGASVEFTKSIPVTGITGIQSIESVTISGSGSGAQWQATGIAINATATT